MPRDSAAADRPASYLVGTAAAFPLFFRDRTKPINQLPFSPSAKFPKSGSSCESRASFFAQVKKHHMLALFSTVRLHKVQALMNLRQVLEAGACAAFAIANPDHKHFVDTDE